MSSYDQLAAHLSRRPTAQWQASFEEIESIIGRKLPNSAYRHPAWWANQTGPGHSQTRGGREAGWRTSKVNLAERNVMFERERAESRSGDQSARIDDLVERAKVIMGKEDREEIIAAALEDYLYRETIEYLIALGGTMPDFEAAPRERPFA